MNREATKVHTFFNRSFFVFLVSFIFLAFSLFIFLPIQALVPYATLFIITMMLAIQLAMMVLRTLIEINSSIHGSLRRRSTITSSPLWA